MKDKNLRELSDMTGFKRQNQPQKTTYRKYKDPGETKRNFE